MNIRKNWGLLDTEQTLYHKHEAWVEQIPDITSPKTNINKQIQQKLIIYIYHSVCIVPVHNDQLLPQTWGLG
jgi:hypothetical protein